MKMVIVCALCALCASWSLGACDAGGAGAGEAARDSEVSDADEGGSLTGDTVVGDASAGDGAVSDASPGDSGAADVIDTTDLVDTDSLGDAVDVSPPAAPQVTLTVNEIPAEMNGSQPYSDTDGALHDFTLRVNRALTTLDVIADHRAGPVDWDSLEVTCATGGGDPIALGTFEEVEIHGEIARRFRFEPDNPLPDGARVHCEASGQGPGGAFSSALSFDAATLPAALDPFVEVDQWLVVLSRDIFALEVHERPDGTLRLTSTYVPAGNGVPDFDEPFFVMGLMSEQNATAAAAVKAHLLRVVRREANRIYHLDDLGRPTPGGVPLRLWFEGDEGAPTPADYAAGGLSMIALGGDGDPDDQGGGIFGRALIDWNNQEHEDDTVYGLGVFPTGVVRAAVGLPLGIYLLEGMMPSQGGVPIGEAAGDALFIGQDIDPATIDDPATRDRAELYDLGIRMGGLALASILTHEIGHSLGLVPFGPPPEGLFAGVAGPAFLESFAPDAHIDTKGLNIMQTGGSVNWMSALSAVPEFNPLNLAYLRRQLVVGAL